MLCLAVETTSPTGSMTLARDLRPLLNRSWKKAASHSEVITSEFEALLREADVALSDITHLALDVGPGSFTGIRVGLNFVKTLSYARNLPVCLITALKVHAMQDLKAEESAILHIPAVQNYVYAAAYKQTKTGLAELTPIRSVAASDLEKWREELNVHKILKPSREPESLTLVNLMAQGPDLPKFVPWEHVQPLYIRASEAEEKLRKGLLKPLPF